ncbi:MAG: hypothetical protein QOE45_2518 [Frankiaceae bacterium]|nr:hypothetical protein [Frankiaceae bacterium]
MTPLVAETAPPHTRPITSDRSTQLKRFVGYLRVSSDEQTKTNARDGYSIDVQREMVERKAVQLGGEVVEWFVDPGRSAKNLNRPDLTRMRQYLRDHPEVDGVIVAWLDRLSRNTEDAVVLFTEFRETGVHLISCSESFDETPAGKFMRAIFTAKAQYDNDDRAERVTRGIQKKLEQGGTPTRAHIGYLNTRKRVGGKDIATVVVDDERIGHIQWAFEQYATGEWSDSTLWLALVERGLTSQPRGDRPEVPVARSKVATILTDRYYLGQVPYKGQWYRGEHPQTIDPELFDRVQEIRTAHRHAGDKPSQHRHYLKGTLYCGHCGSRLGMTPSTGNGGTYDYTYCIERHLRGTCQQPHVVVDRFEPQVIALYDHIRIVPKWRERVRACLRDDADADLGQRQREIARLTKRLAQLAVEKKNLAISLRKAPRLAEEINAQLDDIEAQEKAATKRLADANLDRDTLAKVYADAERLLDRLPLAARIVDEHGRRLLNQFFFEKVLVKGHQLVGVIYTETARLILGYPSGPVGPGGQSIASEITFYGATNPDPLSGVQGSNIDSLVGAAGVEPATARV